MAINRRDMCFVLSGLLPIATGMEAFAVGDSSLPSGTFSFDQLPINVANNAQIRPVLRGKLDTGESLEVHETTLPPGGMPHAAHHHLHSEMWLIREGTVELTISGTSHVLGPGSVGFVHSDEQHGVKNIGTAPATYFVVAVGPGAGS
jgi:quercetin dioxygenase-like cupin family protein